MTSLPGDRRGPEAPGAAPPEGPPGVPVTYHSQGVRCAALLWRPPDLLAAPAVVLCHGFRGIKEWALPEFAALFAELGYVALAIDYRGFGGSDGQRGRLVPADQVEDIRSALSWLEAQPYVDGTRLHLYGTSFGGANVVAAAAADERVRAVVCQVGIGDVRRAWPDAYRRFKDRMREDRIRRAVTGRSETVDPGEVLDNAQSNAAFAVAERRWPQLRQRFPLEALDRIFEFAPERVVADIAPRGVLFIGASSDEAVPVQETQSLYDAAAQPKRLEVFDIEHYAIYESPHRERAVALSHEFFDAATAGRDP